MEGSCCRWRYRRSARRNSFTSRSCSVRLARSTRPLAWLELAQRITLQSARPNCVMPDPPFASGLFTERQYAYPSKKRQGSRGSSSIRQALRSKCPCSRSARNRSCISLLVASSMKTRSVQARSAARTGGGHCHRFGSVRHSSPAADAAGGSSCAVCEIATSHLRLSTYGVSAVRP